jgi:hypothetical protein
MRRVQELEHRLGLRTTFELYRSYKSYRSYSTDRYVITSGLSRPVNSCKRNNSFASLSNGARI